MANEERYVGPPPAPPPLPPGPAPWALGQASLSQAGRVIYDASGREVAYSYCLRNDRLLLVAPRLLAALQMAIDDVTESGDHANCLLTREELAEIRTVIREATDG